MSSKIRVQRVCQHCQNEFTAKTTVTKYCSDRCAKLAYKQRKRTEKIAASNQETQEQLQRPFTELQMKEFLTVKEISNLFGISRTTLWRLIKQKKLNPAKIGRRIIIKKSDLYNLFY